MKILVLGHNGLLGNMVFQYFKSQRTTPDIIEYYRWPEEEFKNHIRKNQYDYIINCIGIIPQKQYTDYSVNYELPIWLESNSNARIIYPATDCDVNTDEYGISKKKAIDWVVNESKNTKAIKTSIIGTEIRNQKFSLMEWFLSNKDGDSVDGYTDFFWNGNTTLTWAKFCQKLITNWDKYRIINTISSECISKYELLKAINEIYERKIIINKNDKIKDNKCLSGGYKMDNIHQQLMDLKKFNSDNGTS